MSVFEARDGPREVYAKVNQYASGGQSDLVLAEGESAIGKLRLVGIYDDRQEGYFMLRIRIPGGRLHWQQAEAIGQIAEQFSLRPENEAAAPQQFLEITTRQDIQLHWIRLDHLPQIWERLEQAGLTSLQACGDTARNVTGCPVAGIDKNEVADAYPLVQEANRYVLEHPEWGAFLPRKFKIAITGCRDDCILARVNDLAFVPAHRQGEVGFNVLAGGGLSDYPRLASDMDLFVKEEQVVPTIQAAIGVFKDFGDYQNKAVNRFRRVVEEMGPAAIREEMLKRLPFPSNSAGESLTGSPRHDHVGVHPQRQGGLSYVGIVVPVGRMLGRELMEAARLARGYGDGVLRLTPRQNLIISGVPDASLDHLLSQPLLKKFSPTPPTFQRSVVACTSAPFCKFGIFNVKEHGLRLSNFLDSVFPTDELGPVKLHLSGCKASCAQVQIADIGLRATMAKDESGFYEAFDIAAGGSLGEGRLAEWIELEIPATRAYQGLQGLLSAYQAQRSPGETFGQFVRRLGKDALHHFFQEVKL